jgi:hypothetical protein
MSLPEGKTRYEVPFPPGKQGFASSVDYWIAQDDNRSKTFRIDVRPTASIEIVSLKYRFPHYTGLPEKIVENTGDIRAVEGTEVKIGVRSTIPLQRIDLVFDNDPLKVIGMQIMDENPTEATATITLKLDPQNTTQTTIRNFSFRATDQEGYESRRSGVFRLEVLPDQSPMVQWADTDTQLKDVAQFDLPLNNSLELSIQAEDRDFGLRYLRFHVESGNKQIRPVELLESPATGATEHKGSIQRKTVFSPITSRLAEGDTAEIWAEAVDTKFPNPNNATTRRITVQIVAPQKQEPLPKENEKNPDDEKENRKSENKEQQENKQQEPEKNQNQQDNAENREQNEHSDNNSSEKQENSGKETGEKDEQQKSDDSQNGQNGEEQTKESTQQENFNTSESPNSDENSVRKNNDQNDSNQNNSSDEYSEQKNSDSLKNNSSTNDLSDNEKQDKQNGKENQSQPVQEEQGDSSKKSDPQGEDAKKTINPETQDGDAMEEILKQMKKEGKFNDKKLNEDKDHNTNSNDKNDNQNNNNRNHDQKNNEQNREQQDDRGQNPKGTENQTNSKSTDSMPNSQSEQQQQSEQNSEKQGSEKQRESDSQQNNSNKTDTKNNEQTNSGNGKNQQSDSVSESSGNSGDNPNSQQQHQDVPVDPADKTPRQRDDSLDTNSTERSNQGGDSNKPKESDVSSANDSVTDGNNGNSQETKQQDQSNQTQSTKSSNFNNNYDNKSDSENKNGVENQNNATKNFQSGGNEQETGLSNESESDELGNSNQNISNQATLSENENFAAGRKPSDKPSQNSSSENSTNNKNSIEKNPDQLSSSKTENNSSPATTTDSDNKSDLTTGQGTSAANVETPIEDANLEYSKKITNLVLEYLEDQLKSKPSQELLDNLGWSEKELRDFHRKWREMSEQSKHSESTTTNDNTKWKEAFKSLGLRPAQDRQQLQKSRTKVQDENKVTESQRFTPPPAIKDRFKRYTEGIGK